LRERKKGKGETTTIRGKERKDGGGKKKKTEQEKRDGGRRTFVTVATVDSNNDRVC